MAEHAPSYLGQILDAVADPIFVKDKEHRWVYVNAAFCRFLGHTKEELLGRSDFDFIPQAEAQVFWEKDDEVFRTGVTLENEERFTGSDGTTKIISTKKARFVTSEGEEVLVGVIRDLSRIKETERKLRKAKELAETGNQAKARFLASMSHEIRTPLNGILGMADLLLDRPLEGEMREQLSFLKESADHLLYLVNEVLDFSSIETGKLTVNETAFSVRSLVLSIQFLFQPQVEKKRLNFDVQVDENVSQEVVGDPNRIRQILFNLVGNAVKFTEPGGSVCLYVEQEGEVKDGKTELGFRVKDTGTGIPERQRERIFRPFVKLRPFDKGTGLGLAIVTKLVGLLGGRLELESEEGKGSEFRTYLPLEAVPNEELGSGDTQDTRPDEFPGFRVLVVEDDPVSQRVAVFTLKKLQCEVVLAKDGVEGLELWEQEDFQFVLLDCQMPRMDGFQFSHEVRSREKAKSLPRTPIVALTAHALVHERDRCLEAGMDDWLTKPLVRNKLAEILHRFYPAPNGKAH